MELDPNSSSFIRTKISKILVCKWNLRRRWKFALGSLREFFPRTLKPVGTPVSARQGRNPALGSTRTSVEPRTPHGDEIAAASAAFAHQNERLRMRGVRLLVQFRFRQSQKSGAGQEVFRNRCIYRSYDPYWVWFMDNTWLLWDTVRKSKSNMVFLLYQRWSSFSECET